MHPKSILVIVNSADQEAPLAAAEQLGKRWGAHVSVLLLSEIPVLVGSHATFGADMWSQVVAEAREAADKQHQRIIQRLSAFERPAEARAMEVTTAGAGRVAAFHALHADLTIFERSEDELLAAAIEGALFRSGRPVLLMPPEWRGGALGKRIMAAWVAKPEASRAIADSAFFLSNAEHVSVVTVDAPPDPEGAAPGVNIATYLARHGLDVELRQTDGLGRAIEDALIDEARAIDADLIVMGGYGHSRVREFVFGGATRGMIRKSPFPLFMSH
jgi:nucleotide-binding universal stress UspA family protein